MAILEMTIEQELADASSTDGLASEPRLLENPVLEPWKQGYESSMPADWLFEILMV